jgi:hypothetical protein
MKKLLFTAFAAAVLTGSFVAVAAEKKEPSPEQKAKMLEKYDKNKDGKLDDTEKAAMKEDMAKKKKKKAE